MTTRKTAIVIAIAAMFTLSAGSALADEANNRLMTQRDRISEGLRSGALTRKEARRLLKQQIRIEKRIGKKRGDDGALTAKQAKKMDDYQQKAAHRIYKLKSNQRTQNR